MPRYEVGEVVLVLFPYQDHNGDIQVKTRPGLIYQLDGDRERVIIQITTTNRSDKLPGKWIPKDSEIGKKMGLLADSFINAGTQLCLRFEDIIRVIGFCPIMDEIEKIVEDNNIKPKDWYC